MKEKEYVIKGVQDDFNDVWKRDRDGKWEPVDK